MDGEWFENGVPLPFERSGAVGLQLSGVDGAVVVRGTGISVVLAEAAGPAGPIEHRSVDDAKRAGDGATSITTPEEP